MEGGSPVRRKVGTNIRTRIFFEIAHHPVLWTNVACRYVTRYCWFVILLVVQSGAEPSEFPMKFVFFVKNWLEHSYFVYSLIELYTWKKTYTLYSQTTCRRLSSTSVTFHHLASYRVARRTPGHNERGSNGNFEKETKELQVQRRLHLLQVLHRNGKAHSGQSISLDRWRRRSLPASRLANGSGTWLRFQGGTSCRRHHGWFLHRYFRRILLERLSCSWTNSLRKHGRLLSGFEQPTSYQASAVIQHNAGGSHHQRSSETWINIWIRHGREKTAGSHPVLL